MSRATFRYVRDLVAPELAPNPAAIGPVVDLDRRVAIALYVLSTTTEFRNIGHLFGVHKSTVHVIYRKFAHSGTRHLHEDGLPRSLGRLGRHAHPDLSPGGRSPRLHEPEGMAEL